MPVFSRKTPQAAPAQPPRETAPAARPVPAAAAARNPRRPDERRLAALKTLLLKLDRLGYQEQLAGARPHLAAAIAHTTAIDQAAEALRAERNTVLASVRDGSASHLEALRALASLGAVTAQTVDAWSTVSGWLRDALRDEEHTLAVAAARDQAPAVFAALAAAAAQAVTEAAAAAAEMADPAAFVRQIRAQAGWAVRNARGSADSHLRIEAMQAAWPKWDPHQVPADRLGALGRAGDAAARYAALSDAARLLAILDPRHEFCTLAVPPSDAELSAYAQVPHPLQLGVAYAAKWRPGLHLASQVPGARRLPPAPPEAPFLPGIGDEAGAQQQEAAYWRDIARIGWQQMPEWARK